MPPTPTTTSTCTVPGLPHPVSRAALGTMTFGDTADETTSAELLDIALANGVTVVDTANGYAGGETERMLGRLLGPRREQVVLATKAGMPHPDAGDHPPLSPAGLRSSLEGSLRRLGTDRVDLLYLHQPDRETPIQATMDTLAELVAEGRVGAIGISNFAAWRISESFAAADVAGAPRPVVAQQLYNLLARRLEDEYAELADHHRLHTMVYNPLGGGLLTGRHQLGEVPSEGRFASSRLAAMYRDRYWDPGLFHAVTRCSGIAGLAGISLVELSVRWLLARPVTGSVLLGASRPEQLRESLQAMGRGPLDPATVEACEAVGAELRGPMPAYHR